MDQPAVPEQASKPLVVLPERKPFAGLPEVLREFQNDPPSVRLAALGLCVINAGWPYLGRAVVGLVSVALFAWQVWLRSGPT